MSSGGGAASAPSSPSSITTDENATIEVENTAITEMTMVVGENVENVRITVQSALIVASLKAVPPSAISANEGKVSGPHLASLFAVGTWGRLILR